MSCVSQVRQFEAAAAAAPADADLQVALGVLHNLSRNFDGAEAAFRNALALRPGDYSLWNKLGAQPLPALETFVQTVVSYASLH